MGADGSRQIRQGIELLHLARAGDGEEASDGELTIVTPIAEHDLSPLHGRSEGSLGGTTVTIFPAGGISQHQCDDLAVEAYG